MTCVICGILHHPPLDHFYGSWFDKHGHNSKTGHGEPWDEHGILEAIWAMERKFV